MTGKLKALSRTKKVLLGTGAFILLAGVVGSQSSPPQKEKELTQNTGNHSQVKGESTDQKPQPVIETKNIEEKIVVPYQSTTRNDRTLPAGQTSISVVGVNGEKTITYKVTYTDSRETNREKISEVITKEPINEVKNLGTKVAQAPKPQTQTNCDPNYSGACVPIASDVDCAGGSGNGPAYVSGPVHIIGTDIYDLDRDGDGVGCE